MDVKKDITNAVTGGTHTDVSTPETGNIMGASVGCCKEPDLDAREVVHPAGLC
jgi:hypothetical protein